MTAVCQEEKTVIKKEKTIKNNCEGIPQDMLLDFIGYIPNFLKVDQHRIWKNKYRINVWTEYWQEGRICATHRIAKSFYVKYDGRKITDESK